MSVLSYTSHAQIETWRCVEVTNPYFTNVSVNQNQSPPIPDYNLDIDSQSYPDSDPERKHAYKVKFYIIRDDNGDRTDFVGEEIVMNAIRDLNLNYKNSNIYFKYGGFEYVDDSNLTGNRSVQFLYEAFSDFFVDPDAFKLVILDGAISLGNDENGNEVTVPGLAPPYSTVSFYSYRGITSRRIPSHEVGHNFNLKHVSSTMENVIRLQYEGSGYNAQFAGDKVHDTPAYKSWNNNQFNSSGIYVGDDIDNNEALPVNDVNRRYSSQSPKINNLMFVHDGEDLAMGYEFTPGQVKRMRYYISEDETTSTYDFIGASVPIESIYEPFETILVEGETVATVTDNGDGTAKVCRNILQKDRFQKGFYMSFSDDNEENFLTSTPNDLVEIVSPVRNLYNKIASIYADFEVKIPVPCYRGTICVNEPYIGGQIISTQVLGSMNLTVKELNDIEVNDPALFEQLLEQYYHILKKITSSGVVDEKVIYKS